MSAAYMRFWVGDFLKNTGHLSCAEVGAYTLLILFYFEQGGLPDDDTRLARICRLNGRNWRRMRPTLEAFFEPGWRHKTIDEEIIVARGKAGKAAASSRVRWQKRGLVEATKRRHSETPENELRNEENFDKSVVVLCERIANASEKASERNPMSESESDSVDNKKDSTRDSYDRLKCELWPIMPAGSWQRLSVETLTGLSDLLREGYDIDTEIVPKVREIVARQPEKIWTSWAYFVSAIRSARSASASARVMPQPIRVKVALPADWEPASEDRDFGKSCGLREEELNSVRNELRAWSKGSVERDDWSNQFRRKCEEKAKALGRRSLAEEKAAEARQREASDEISAYMAARGMK